MDNLAKNLNLLLKMRNMNASELSKESGVDKARISRILAEKITNPQLDTLTRIADCFDVSIDQLIGKASIESELIPGKIIPSQQLVVPVISWEAATIWKSIKDNYMPAKTVFANSKTSKNTFALTVTDDQYEPRFSQDSILVIDPSRKAKNRDFVLLTTNNQNFPTICQVIAHDNKMHLKTLDVDFKIQEYCQDSHEIIGVITEVHFDTDI